MDAKQARRSSSAGRTRARASIAKERREEKEVNSNAVKRGRLNARASELKEVRKKIREATRKGKNKTAFSVSGIWSGSPRPGDYEYYDAVVKTLVKILTGEGYEAKGSVDSEHYSASGSDQLFYESFDYYVGTVEIKW